MDYFCRFVVVARRGYAEAEIEAVFSKYDVNGDRALDDTELRQMAADLEGQKVQLGDTIQYNTCLLYTSPSPRDRQKSRMPSSA